MFLKHIKVPAVIVQNKIIDSKINEKQTIQTMYFACYPSLSFLSLFSTFAYVYNCSYVDIGCLITLLRTSNILLV